MRKKIVGLIVLLFGAASWTPAVKDLIKAIFWDRVLHLMSPIFEIPVSVAFGYGLPAVLVVCGLYFVAGPESWLAAAHWVRTKLNLYLAASFFLATCSVVALALYFWDRSKGPIEWVWDSNSPLGYSRSYGGPLWIDGFQIKGRNRSSEPISPHHAYIRSDVSAKVLPLQFSGVRGLIPTGDVTIPAETPFILSGVIPPTDPTKSDGIIVDLFRIEFSRFTFNFSYNDGKSYEVQFSARDVEYYISLADRESRESLEKTTPRGIITKSDK